jgi:hypothetical protein
LPRPASRTPRSRSQRPRPTCGRARSSSERYLATVVLGLHLDRLSEEDREAFTREVAQRLPRPQVEYVRLRISARLPG